MLLILMSVAAGFVCQFVAGRCRGRNAKSAFTNWSWAFWLTNLRFCSMLFAPLIGPLMALVLLIPSVMMFLVGANNVVKEMRSQQVGEYTDAS